LHDSDRISSAAHAPETARPMDARGGKGMEGNRITAGMIAPCGHIISVHTGVCSGCGRPYGTLMFRMNEDT